MRKLQNWDVSIKILSFVSACILSCLTLQGQSDYSIGSATESIEPDSSSYSLALTGYETPRDGRFTLTWRFLNQAQNLTAITALENFLYATTLDSNILKGSFDGKIISWKKMGRTLPIKSLAANREKLYGINEQGDLLSIEINELGGVWKTEAKGPKLKTIVFWHNQLYAVNSQDELLVTDLQFKKISWKRVGIFANILSMAADDQKIYAICSDSTLYSYKPYISQMQWIKIGYFNSFNFNIDIKEIAILSGKLYAVATNNGFYMADQSTRGDLCATTLAIKNNNQTVVIAGVDMISFDYALANEVKAVIFKDRGIPPEAILINASHTHFSPSVQWFPTYGDFLHYPDSNYLTLFKKKLIKAIETSLDRLKESKLYFGRGSTAIGHNRSSKDGLKPYDSTLDILKVQDGNGKINTMLFLTGCHPVFRDEKWEDFTMTANFPGTVRRMLKYNTGAEDAIFIQGCAGDINPTSEEYELTGRDLGTDILKILNHDMKEIKGGISYFLDTIEIPAKAWTVEELNVFREENLNKVGDVYAERNLRWTNLMLTYRKNAKSDTQFLPVYVQTLNIGDWKLVALSRETVTEYGLAIRRLWPERRVSVAGYSNDISSYLPNRWHIVDKTYEGYDSFFWYPQPLPAFFPENAFETIIQRIKLLNR